MSNYGAAKTGLVGFTRVLAAEGQAWASRSTPSPRSATRMLACSISGASQPDDPADNGFRDHLDEIRSGSGYTVPGGPGDEMAELLGTIMSG